MCAVRSVSAHFAFPYLSLLSKAAIAQMFVQKPVLALVEITQSVFKYVRKL